MVDCLQLLLTGDILTGITCPFTNVIGLYFFAIMLAATEISIAIRYDNIMAPSVLGLFAGVLMIATLPPEAYIIPLFIFIVNGGTVLYSMYIRD
jgi:hypothetical protein